VAKEAAAMVHQMIGSNCGAAPKWCSRTDNRSSEFITFVSLPEYGV